MAFKRSGVRLPPAPPADPSTPLVLLPFAPVRSGRHPAPHDGPLGACVLAATIFPATRGVPQPPHGREGRLRMVPTGSPRPEDHPASVPRRRSGEPRDVPFLPAGAPRPTERGRRAGRIVLDASGSLLLADARGHRRGRLALRRRRRASARPRGIAASTPSSPHAVGGGGGTSRPVALWIWSR